MTRPGPDRQLVLVIRLGALGDLVQCFDAFHRIRRNHPGAEIILLTKPAFAGFARQMPWFDQVWEDARSRSPLHYWRMRRWLRQAGLSIVYDLQNKPRTRLYRRLLWPGRQPLWSGNDGTGDFPAPALAGLHNHDRYLAQLTQAGLAESGAADLSWLDGDLETGDLAGRIPAGRLALLVPGCSPHLPHKRWPAAHYADLGNWLLTQGITPLLVGTGADRAAADAILAACPRAIDLVGRTGLGQVAALARRAVAAIGNDTGPIFLTAALGCPTLMLMSHHTDPVRSAPWGPAARWLKCPELDRLAVAEVQAAVAPWLPADPVDEARR